MPNSITMIHHTLVDVYDLILITLNSSDWLRVHSMPKSINMVHQSSANVCHPLITNLKRNITLIHCKEFIPRSNPSKETKVEYQKISSIGL
jgi:hypothetical protein